MLLMFDYNEEYTTENVYESEDIGGYLSSKSQKRGTGEFNTSCEEQYHDRKA